MPSRVIAHGLVLALVVALAGCAQQLPGGEDRESPDPNEIEGTPVSAEAGRAAMVEAFSNAGPPENEERFEVRVTLSKAGEVMARLLMQLDESTEERLQRIEGLRNLMDEEDRGGSGASFMPPEGVDTLWIYAVGQAVVFHAPPNATAIYDKEGDSQKEDSSFFDSESDQSNSGPGGGMPDFSEDFFESFQDYREFDVESAEEITYNGKPAMKIRFNHTAEEGTLTGLMVVYVDPHVPAYIEGQVQSDGSSDPTEPDAMKMEFAYGADVEMATTPVLSRAAALATDPSEKPMWGEAVEATVHFWGAGLVDVAVSEVHFVAKPPERDDGRYGSQGSDSSSPVPADYRFVMPLGAGLKEDERLVVSFDDADADGKISVGDAYTIKVKDRENDSLNNYAYGLLDTVTATFVTPGAGVTALLGVLALAGAAFRTRR